MPRCKSVAVTLDHAAPAEVARQVLRGDALEAHHPALEAALVGVDVLDVIAAARSGACWRLSIPRRHDRFSCCRYGRQCSQGIDGLTDRPRGGWASRLTPGQEPELSRIIIEARIPRLTAYPLTPAASRRRPSASATPRGRSSGATVDLEIAEGRPTKRHQANIGSSCARGHRSLELALRLTLSSEIIQLLIWLGSGAGETGGRACPAIVEHARLPSIRGVESRASFN